MVLPKRWKTMIQFHGLTNGIRPSCYVSKSKSTITPISVELSLSILLSTVSSFAIEYWTTSNCFTGHPFCNYCSQVHVICRSLPVCTPYGLFMLGNGINILLEIILVICNSILYMLYNFTILSAVKIPILSFNKAYFSVIQTLNNWSIDIKFHPCNQSRLENNHMNDVTCSLFSFPWQELYYILPWSLYIYI